MNLRQQVRRSVAALIALLRATSICAALWATTVTAQSVHPLIDEIVLKAPGKKATACDDIKIMHRSLLLESLE